MRLPEPVAEGVGARVGRVAAVGEVAGGCISTACRVEIAGEPYFLKYDAEAAPGFFATEAEGLEALAAAAPPGIRLPRVIAVDEDAGSYGWIVMEWLEPGSPAGVDEAGFGAGLARLHGSRGESWGWGRDGYIGRLPQSNRTAPDWATFWWSERIAPQLDGARRHGVGGEGWELLGERLPELLAPAQTDGPSLLHGDLWSGNVLYSRDGPALIDPACYYGHREVDLAMAELFGGFGRDFFRGYLDRWPLAAGWEGRRLVYQLYYLLVHVNLFGSGYVSRTETTLRAALAA